MRLKEDGRSGVGDDIVVDSFQLLGIDRYPIEAARFDDEHASLERQEDSLRQSPINNLLLVAEWCPGRNQAEVPMPPSEPVASISRVFAPSRAAAAAAGAAGGTAPGHDDIECFVQREISGRKGI